MDEEPFEVRVQPAIKHYGPPEAYKNITNPRGAVFIANYMKFDKELEERTGTEVNVNQLRELFTQMNYDVETFDTSGTYSDTITALESFSQRDTLKEADSLVVIFSSHGQEDNFFTSDGELIHYKTIYQMFNDANCPHLKGKPKIFMFQFCRGESPLEKSGISSSNIRTQSKRRQRVSCTYICLSTAEGRKSYRTDTEGALFFHHVCRVFMENAKDQDLGSLMKMVTEKLPEFQPAEMRQENVRKCFYFNPPLIGQEVLPPVSTNAPSEAHQSLVPVKSEKQLELGISKLQIDGAYKMTSNPQGKVLIINNLDGCKGDEGKLGDIFSQLGFSVLPAVNNVSYEEMRRQIENFKKGTHYDAAIIIMYGYGFEDHIMSADNKPMSYREIVKMFNDGNCPALEGKPKIFIINSCCKDQEDTEASNSRPSENEFSTGATPSKLADKDAIIYGVEVEGGNCEQGSLLTDALYQVLLCKTNTREELMPLLRLVSDTLEKLSENSEEEYFVVTYNFRFEKDFYFRIHDPNPDAVDAKSSSTVNQPVEFRKKVHIPNPSVRKSFKGIRVYKSSSPPQRQAFIICFSGYESKQLPKSCGLFGEVDVYRKVVEDLGYNAKMLKNCDKESIKHSLKTLDRMEVTDSLMVIFFGLTQDVNNLYDVKGEVLPVSDIFDIFSDINCPAMKGKPKLFCFHMNVFPDLKERSLLPISKDVHDAFAYFLVSSNSANKHFLKAGLDSIYTTLERNSSSTDLESMIREAEEQLATQRQEQKDEAFILMNINFRKEFYFNPIYVSNQ